MNWGWEIFSATLRSSRVSRALKTWPIPPSPIGAITWYGPNLRAGSSDIHGHCTRRPGAGGIDSLRRYSNSPQSDVQQSVPEQIAIRKESTLTVCRQTGEVA